MGSILKRPEDEKKGKLGKYTIVWVDADGKRHKKKAYTDKSQSENLLNRKENEARQIRDGLLTRSEVARKEASTIPLARHVADYRLSILANGRTEKHAGHIAGTLTRVLGDASVTSIEGIAGDRIVLSLARLKASRSARTANHARGAVKAFCRWLAINGRISEVPPAIAGLSSFNEKADRKRVRRALAKDEIDRLLSAAESGPPVKLSRRGYQYEERWITGPERAALYRLAMGTGFRADELRTLVPERFALDGPEPTITVLACYAKNGKEAVQPIATDLADRFRPFLAGKPPGRPVLDVPDKTAKLLRGDLGRAGIPYRDSQGRVADFHALRHSYITHLIRSGVNPKIVQTLARHSTITLTLDRYTVLDDSEVRKALEESS